jgi:TolB-like protein/tetratricopeptide (TPR) repeat protein
MSEFCLEIGLFGASRVLGINGSPFEITGVKHRALFALLATAPSGRRSRSFLQEVLWGAACYDTGRQSLRRALADIKVIMGDVYGRVISSTNSDITLHLPMVRFAGQPGIGHFLEGMDIREPGFVSWVSGIRQNPGQLDSLFRTSLARLRPASLAGIAVLPFRAVGCGEHGFALGDWLAEEMSRQLSRSRLMAVTSHLSSRQFVRTGFDLAGVRSQLRVNYCLTGSIRQTGDILIVDADLVDLESSRILLTRQFTCLARGFTAEAAAQSMPLMRAAAAAIADEALVASAGRAPVEIADHQLLTAGVGLMHRPVLRDFARSRQLIEEALARAPSTPEILAWLAKWHVFSVFNGWSPDVAQETQIALDLAARALDLAPDNAFCLTIDGFAHSNLRRRLDIAEQRYSAALVSNPNESLCWLLKGSMHTFRDEPGPAVEASEIARSLSPLDPFGYYYEAHAAGTYLCAGDYETAFSLADSAFRKNDRHLSSLRIKIFAAHYAGKDALVPELGRQLLQRQPDMTIDAYMRSHPSAGSAMGERMRHALTAANIPQGV